MNSRYVVQRVDFTLFEPLYPFEQEARGHEFIEREFTMAVIVIADEMLLCRMSACIF